MRPELELIEKIEDFLNNRLSAADMAAFRREMAADPELREKVQLQQDIMNGIERASLTQKVKTAGRSFHFNNSFRKWGWGGAATIVVVASAVLLYNYWKNNEHSKHGEYNELGTKEFVDADRKIAGQEFTIDADRDTVIETKGGIVFSIPANNFLYANGKPATGKIDVTVKEALDASTIMTSGLSTKSGERLLETGGMFYIAAKSDDEVLKIDPAKGIFTGVPADTIKPDMQLFQGKRMKDGTIDWVNPAPIKHDLVTVDIESLNFYPPMYLDTVKSSGYDITNKKFTDSLYYSFAAEFSPELDASAKKPVAAESKPYVEEGGFAVADTTKIAHDYIDGKAIFRSKCASCHLLYKNATGPNLAGVKNRWGGNMYQIREWVKNYAKAVQAGYPRAQKVVNFSPSAMTQFEGSITDAEIDAVINYADTVGTATDHDDSYHIGINPAKIKTIWSKEFQNTFIATREFEERLALIHFTYDEEILDLYLNNLDRDLYEIDLMAAQKASKYQGVSEKFIAFAARHDGNVKNSSAQVQKLREYYQKKTKAYTDAITKAQNKFWEKQNKLDIEYNKRKYKYDNDSLARMTQNLIEEYRVNLKDVYRQLGRDTVKPNISPMYTVNVVNAGWNNIDKYVFDATQDRKDMSYTDPETGKTATLTYTPVEFNVANASQYDQVYVYLVPDKLNSFMRVNGSGGKFTEKLNGIIGYDVVCVAYKGEQPYFYSQKGIKPGSYTFELKATNQKQLERELKRSSKTSGISKETRFLKYEFKDLQRQRDIQNIYRLYHKVRPIIIGGEEGQPYYGPLYTDEYMQMIDSDFK